MFRCLLQYLDKIIPSPTLWGWSQMRSKSTSIHQSTGCRSPFCTRLYYGFLVTVWIDRPNKAPTKLEGVKSISIPALMAISPITKNAIVKNGPFERDIDHIILPTGHQDAYKMLFKWLDNTTKTGVYRHIEPEYHSPLFEYHHILEIAENLNITPILDNLRPRYNTMLQYQKNSKWNIQSEEIYRAYRELPIDHELRLGIVRGVALAWYYNNLGGEKRKRIEKITWEIPELWADLNEVWESLERDEI